MLKKNLRTGQLVSAFAICLTLANTLVARGFSYPAEIPSKTAPGSAVLPVKAAATASAPAPVSITILHTNDFHGNLDPAGSTPGIARMAYVISDVVRASVGVSNVVLLDAGDEMQGNLLSNLKKGEPTIDLFNMLGYQAATFGNHEFDWGRQTLISRTQQANYPFVTANIVVSDSSSCDTAGWSAPSFAKPWITLTVGAPGNQAILGIIGVTTLETPYITVASATQGLCFKDPAASIAHYYNDIKAAGANSIIVLSHLGFEDGGYGYGFSVYGDKTLARKLVEANAPVPLIIGGHSHTNMFAPTVISGTTVVQAYYAGRKVGRADLTIDTTADTTLVNWQPITVTASITPDVAISNALATWSNDAAYQAQINQVIGYSNVDLPFDYNGDSLMGEFINDAIYNDLNTDANPANDVDMVFNNAGGIRTSYTGMTTPYTLTYGMLYSVLPFGNQTAVGDMTGAQILDLLNQSASLFKGSIQESGVRFSFFNYTDTLPGPQPWAWGAYSVTVRNRSTGIYEPLVISNTYRVATNEFLAPAGQDGYVPFKYMTNISYWGDMLDGVNRWVSKTYTVGNPYNGPTGTGLADGRVVRSGTAAGGDVIPLTILHNNDSHGNLVKGQYVGFTQLATLINQERAHNPSRNILLNAGDQMQGDSMMYYFKTAPTGYAVDGTTLPVTMTTHPMIAAMNAMTYTAMTLGNHEFNFGHEVFTSVLKQADFPVLQANLYDDGRYGITQVPVKPAVTVTVGSEAIKVAVLGIGNHRVPQYELPSNIPGLLFTNPITEAAARAPALKAANDVVVALTHIGFTTNPKSVEVDDNVDTNLAARTTGIDAIIGGHSHTDPSKQTDSSGDYLYLPAYVGNPDNVPVIINQAYRYDNYLGEVVLGLLPKAGGGYQVVSRAGRDIAVTTSTSEDTRVKDLLQPYVDALNTYNATTLGQTTQPIDTLNAFTQETNGANMQADASVFELAQHGINVDFHLSGAMTNKKVASTASVTSPYTLTVSDMFSAMPYENSLVVMRMNGPQLKTVLERAYRNYFYYKYVPGYGGYSYYTTCMIDINSGGQITYRDTYPSNPNGNNVASLVVKGHPIDLLDATKFYTVSTVNYLAAGSCNNNDGGATIWPLNQIVADTQYYVRDAMIDYLHASGLVTPVIEGRLQFLPYSAPVGTVGAELTYTGTHGNLVGINVPPGALTQTVTLAFAPSETATQAGTFVLAGQSFSVEAFQGSTLMTGFTFGAPVTVTLHYTVADLGITPASLVVLKTWSNGQWVDAACGPYDRHPAEHWLSVPICHLSQFALGTHRLIMPVVVHGS
jgi:2',3'-cyclic-nucleotide 2'-phosphodiesterase (5'-nucleotidase family)